MSIIKTRSFLEKSGCGIATAVVSMIVMLFGMVVMTRGCNKDANGQTAGDPIVFSVAGIDYKAMSIEKITSRQSEVQFGVTIQELPPILKAQVYKQVITELVNNARLIKLGEKMNVTISDSDMSKKQEEIVANALQSMYSRYVASEKDPKNPNKSKTNKVMTFDEFKNRTDVQEQVAKSKSLFAEYTSTPDGAAYLRAGFVREALIKSMTKADKTPKGDKNATNPMIKASMELQTKLKDIEKEYPATWKDEAYRLLYAWGTAEQDVASLKKLAKEASAAPSKEATLSTNISSLAFYGIVEDLVSVSKGQDKDAVRKLQIASMNAILETTEDFMIRLKLVDLLIEEKDGPQAASVLKLAIENNRKYDAQGLSQFKQAETSLKKLVDLKLLTNEELASVQKEIDSWNKDRLDDEKARADEAKARAEQAKIDEAERLKYEKENKELEKKEKAKNEAAKKAGSTTPPVEKKPVEKK